MFTINDTDSVELAIPAWTRKRTLTRMQAVCKRITSHTAYDKLTDHQTVRTAWFGRL